MKTRVLFYAICTLALVATPAVAQSDRPQEDMPDRGGLVAVYCKFLRDANFRAQIITPQRDETRQIGETAIRAPLLVVNGTPRDTLSVGFSECRDDGQVIPPGVENVQFLFGPKTADFYGHRALGGVLRFDYVSSRDH